MPVALGRGPGRKTVRTTLTPTLVRTDIQEAPIEKRRQHTESKAAEPSMVPAPNTRKRLKSSGNEMRHSPKVTPTSPASPLLDDDSGPVIDSPHVRSLAPIPERFQQRRHCSATELRLDRRKSIERVQNARIKGKGISTQSSVSGDKEQRHLVPQSKKSQAGISGPSSDAARPSLPAKAASSSELPESKGFLSSLLFECVRRKEERLFASVDLKTLRNQIRIWSGRCSLCYIRGYWRSRHHKITQCPAAGADQVRQTRNVLQRKMISLSESGGSFCSGQCQLSMNIALFSSDQNLEPECACESAVLDALSATSGRATTLQN
jgi:hypothetical protein